MAEADAVRSRMKLKKTEQPRITNFRVMLETCDQMAELGMSEYVNRIRNFVDMSGRLRVVSGQAAEFINVSKLIICYLSSMHEIRSVERFELTHASHRLWVISYLRCKTYLACQHKSMRLKLEQLLRCELFCSSSLRSIVGAKVHPCSKTLIEYE
jgi:hypothetical protein